MLVPPKMKPRASSSTSSLKTANRLAPRISQVVILHAETHLPQPQNTVFTLRVDPYQDVNARSSYIIKRNYADFVIFCESLAAERPNANRFPFYRNNQRDTAPKLSKHEESSKSSDKQDIAKLQSDTLDSFCKSLFKLSPAISQAQCVNDFFGSRKEDLDAQLRSSQKQNRQPRQRQRHVTLAGAPPPQLLMRPRSCSTPVPSSQPMVTCILYRSASQPNPLRRRQRRMTPNNNSNKNNTHGNDIYNRTGKRNNNNPLRRTRPAPPPLPSPIDVAPFLYFPPPESTLSTPPSQPCESQSTMPKPSSSTQRIYPKPSKSKRWALRAKPLATFCTQAAHLITSPTLWRQKRVQAPLIPSTSLSPSMPISPSMPLPVARPDNTFPSRVDMSSSIVSTASHRVSHQIRVKVVYDIDNIVIIQVMRTIRFKELRAQILEKFKDLRIKRYSSLVLIYNDARGSASSVIPEPSGSSLRISGQRDWDSAMRNQWQYLEKITLRCCLS